MMLAFEATDSSRFFVIIDLREQIRLVLHGSLRHTAEPRDSLLMGV